MVGTRDEGSFKLIKNLSESYRLSALHAAGGEYIVFEDLSHRHRVNELIVNARHLNPFVPVCETISFSVLFSNSSLILL